jgi:hypothetical protein
MLNLSDKEFSKKEMIGILLKEYDALRAEILSRSNSHHQLVGITATLIAATLAFGAARVDFDRGFLNANVAVIVAVVISLIAAAMLAAHIAASNTTALGRHIATLEEKINKLAGAELLSWESCHGAGTQGWLTRPVHSRQPIQ